MNYRKNHEENLKNYLEKFRKHFDDQANTEDFKYYQFSRSFEDQPDYVQSIENINNLNYQKSLDLETIFKEKNQRLLLLGEPGAGKTILLRSFAKQMAEKNSNSFLPLFAPIRRWDGKQEIIDWLIDQAKIVDSGIDELLLKQKIEDKKVLLLLDGLDELPAKDPNVKDPNANQRDYRINFIEKLADFENTNENKNKYPIIITCRNRDYEELIHQDDSQKLNLNGAVILKQLNYQEIKNYLESTFGKNSKYSDNLWTILIKNMALRKMVRTPFLLTVLIWPYINNNSENEDDLKQLGGINSTDELFDNFINKSYEREKNKRNNPNSILWSLEELKQILGQIAILMMSDDKPDDNYIGRDILEQVIPNSNIKEFINFSQNLYLLIQSVSTKQDTYRFFHLLLREYFTFRYSYQFLNNDLNQTPTTQQWQTLITKDKIAIALGKLNKLRATDLLIDLLRDSDRDVRYEAAKSLGELKAGVYFRGYKQDFSEPHLISKSLTEFDRKSIKEYFNEFNKSAPSYQPISDLQAEEIFKFSLGIPFVVEQIARMWDVYSNNQQILAPVSKEIKNRYQTPSEQVITATAERFLVHCKLNKKDKRIVYILAMMRRPDEKFLQFMLNVTDVRNKLEELYQRYSFVLPEQLKIDENYAKFLKNDLLTPQKRQNPEVVEINRQAIKYYRECLQSLIENQKLDTAQKRLKNTEFTEGFKDLIHHKFWWSQQNDEVLIYLIPYLLEGWYYNPKWNDGLLEITSQFIPARNKLLQIFYQGLNNSANQKQKSLFLDECKKELHIKEKNEQWENEEWKAITLFKSGELLFDSKEYSKAIQEYELAKEYLSPQSLDLEKTLKARLNAISRLQPKPPNPPVSKPPPQPPIEIPQPVSNPNSLSIIITQKTVFILLSIVGFLLLLVGFLFGVKS